MRDSDGFIRLSRGDAAGEDPLEWRKVARKIKPFQHRVTKGQSLIREAFMKRVTCLMLLLTFVSSLLLISEAKASPAVTQNKKLEEELKALYEKLLDASKKKDEKALHEILADSYTQVVDGGRIRTKEIRIKETLL